MTETNEYNTGYSDNYTVNDVTPVAIISGDLGRIEETDELTLFDTEISSFACLEYEQADGTLAVEAKPIIVVC